MCVLSIKVPIRKKSGNLFNDPCIYKEDLALNYEQWLTCYKTKPNHKGWYAVKQRNQTKPNQTTKVDMLLNKEIKPNQTTKVDMLLNKEIKLNQITKIDMLLNKEIKPNQTKPNRSV